MYVCMYNMYVGVWQTASAEIEIAERACHGLVATSKHGVRTPRGAEPGRAPLTISPTNLALQANLREAVVQSSLR